MSSKKVVHIVGAGFSGLSLACYLSEKFEVHIYEKSSRVGGLIYSRREDGHLIESAAQSIILNELTQSFLKKINCTYIKTLPSAKKRFFYRSKLTRWPLTFFETLSLLRRAIKLVLFKKQPPFEQENIAQWVSRILTPAVSNYIVSPALQGIYAHSADQLSAQMIYKSFKERKKRKRYQGIISGSEGTFDIIKSAYNYLLNKGITIHLNTVYNSDLAAHADSIVVATSAIDARSVVEFLDPYLSQQLLKINMSEVYSTTAIFKNKPKKYQGFGALIPEDQNLKPMGILFNSDIFPNRSHFSSETFIYKKIMSEQDFIKTHQHIFQSSDELICIYQDQHKKLLPVYNQQLFEFNKNYRTKENVYLHGNYLGGIGLSQILERSVILSQKLEKDLLEHPEVQP